VKAKLAAIAILQVCPPVAEQHEQLEGQTMKQTKPRSGEWVIVCDGRKAFILQNEGDDKFINLRSREVYEHADPPTRALGTDTPGRAHPSVGTARSAMEQTDWHDASERVFLEKLARRLDAALMDGETTAFIVIAAPRALGMIRSAYTPAVNRAVRAEISRDYVKMPVHEIEKTFSD
jgi:protein required for attachment to host cells